MKIEDFKQALIDVGVEPALFKQRVEDRHMTFETLKDRIRAARGASEVLFVAFTWAATTEGFHYWDDKWAQLLEREDINGKG